MTSLMFYFFIVGPADRKTVNYHKTIYTLENHPIVIYIGVVFVKKSDVRYLSSHSLNQELFKRQKILFQGFLNRLTNLQNCHPG